MPFDTSQDQLPSSISLAGPRANPFHHAGRTFGSGRTRVGLFLLFVAMVALTSWWQLWLMDAAILLGVAVWCQIPPGWVARRCLTFFPFLLVLILPLLIVQAPPDWERVLKIFGRASLSYLAALLLIATTPLRELLAGLRGWGIPNIFVEQVGMTVRYLFLFRDELTRLHQARAARMPRPALGWWWNANLIAVLFVRVLERAERVQQARWARGDAEGIEIGKEVAHDVVGGSRP